jgi:peptidyl-prolyl cis-trans isomerase D
LKQKKYFEIGRINGEYVSYQDYELRLQNLLEIYKLSGRTNIDEATIETVREQTWQQMVRENILDSQYEKLGIGVSTDEVDDLVLGNNPHQIVQQLFTNQQTGTFDKSFLVNFLKRTEVDEPSKKYWLFFENEIVNDRMNTKYNTLVSKALYVTSKQAEFEKAVSSPTVDLSYVIKNYISLPDSSVTISENEINNYYAENKDDYKRSALRDIEYVTFDVVPSEEDIKQTEEWILKEKEEFAKSADPVEFINLIADTRHIGFFLPAKDVPENLKELVKKEDTKAIFGPYVEDGSYKIAKILDIAQRPDSVHVRHILLTPNQTRSMANAQQLADSLVKLLKSGASFDVLAKANSDDQGSAQIGGDLGWFPEGRMVIPFNNACFTGKKGDIKTAETTFGIHIIEILAQSTPVKKYNIGYVDRKIIPSSATNQKIYSDASSFAGTNDTYEEFNKAVTDLGLNKRVATDIAPQQKELPGLENPRFLIMSLFQAEEGKIILDNSSQAVFEIDDKYVVAFCTRAQEEGAAPLESVKNEIRFALIKDKKAEVISEEFNKQKSSGSSLDDIASVMNLTVQEAAQVNFKSYSIDGIGAEPALTGAASIAGEGVVTGPIKGNNGIFMITANTITTAKEEDLKLLKDRLATSFRMRGSYEAYEALRKSANIEDKRYKFY